MRFISRTGRPSINVRREIVENYATGASRTVQTGLIANFNIGLLRPEERELALARWSFNGLYQEQDEVTSVAPDYRIGLFDSEEAQLTSGWSDEDRELVEETLVDHASKYDEIMVVPRVMIPPPWPRYDDYAGSPRDLVHRLVEDGHDLDAVLTYERATQDRDEVVEGIEALLGDPDALLELQPQPEEILG